MASAATAPKGTSGYDIVGDANMSPSGPLADAPVGNCRGGFREQKRTWLFYKYSPAKAPGPLAFSLLTGRRSASIAGLDRRLL
jgi:hypothetical protein